METKKLHFTILFLIAFTILFAQENSSENDSNFSLTLNINTGQARVENEALPNYNLDVNTTELLANFKLGNYWGLATGLGFSEFTGNGFNTNGNFFHDRDVLKIPVLLTTDKDFNKVNLFTSIGLYGQVIINDEYEYLFATEEDVFNGWTFGLQVMLGAMYNFSDKLSIGLNFATQSDFSKVESENGASISDEQSITQQNTFGIIARLRI